MTQLASSPEVFARELLAQLGLAHAGDVGKLAARLGLTVREVDSEGFEGVLLRDINRLKGIIGIKRSIREEARKRFTVCHEIGHFVLPGHGVAKSVCYSDDIESWRKGMPEQELAANRFAIEVLLPYKEIAPWVGKQTATIALSKRISEEFGTSLTATSLRCVEVTEEKCALVYSVDGSAKWFRANDNFHYFIRIGEKLSDASYAGQLFDNRNFVEPYGAVPADAWLESERLSADARIWEDSFFLPHYNSTITILTIHKTIG